ncbi:MAG TPA: hypothetical protein VGC59_05955, partial [Solirubrobacteraceae bacterium]
MNRAKQVGGTCARRLGRRRLVGVVSWALLTLAVAISAPRAYAAPYSVWACADGAGRLLPDGDWFEVRDGPMHALISTCGDPTAYPATHLLAIAVTRQGNTPTDSGAGWQVQAAPGTRVVGLDLWWSGGTPSFTPVPGRVEVLAPTSIFRVEGPNGEVGTNFGMAALQPNTAGLAYAEQNHWAFRNLSTPSVTLKAWCVSKCQGLPGVGGETFAANVADFEAYRLKTLVEDAVAPAGSAGGVEDGA